MKDYDEIRLRHYFLDQLTQEEKDQVEQDLLMDDDLFEAADAVETDLLDAYARGELAEDERESIVRRLATSPRGQDRLALVKGLSMVAEEEARMPPVAPVIPIRSPSPARQQPFARFAIAASLAGALTVGFWAWHGLPSRGTVEEITFTRNEASLRGKGGERPTATLSPSDILRIQLQDLEKDILVYEVVVSRAGEEVARERLESGHTSVDVPGEKLQEGWYKLVVEGLPEDGDPYPVIRSEFKVVAE